MKRLRLGLKSKFSWLWSGCGLSVVIALPLLPALAQVNSAILTEILGDNEEVFIEEQVAQENDDATLGEEVRTEQARAQLSFNTGAAGRMDENSSIVVGQCIEVEQGAIVASGPANGCISSFAVGVEGTIYLMTVEEDGLGRINVLEGEIQLGLQDNPDDPNPLTIVAGQKVTGLTQGVALNEVVIEQMSKQEYEEIITSTLFRGYQEPLPDQDKIDQVCEELYGNCVAVGSPPPEPPSGTPVRGLW